MPAMFVLGLVRGVGASSAAQARPHQLSILVTFAIALIIEGVLGLIFSHRLRQAHAWYSTASFRSAASTCRTSMSSGSSCSVVLLAALYLLLYRTKFGRSAARHDAEPHRRALIGIDVERVSTLTFGFGVALAAAGGMAFGATSRSTPAASMT